MNAWAVVVAAGRGVRFGQPYNKVFYPLSGRSILSRSLDALAGSCWCWARATVRTIER